MNGKKILKFIGKSAGMGLIFTYGMYAQEFLRRDDVYLKDWPHTKVLKRLANFLRDRSDEIVNTCFETKKEPSE